MSNSVLEIHNLTIQFPTSEGVLQAVNGISFQVPRGRTLGIVGESGSGKSVTALAMMRLVPQPGQITTGEIWFHNDRQSQDHQSDGAEPINLVKLSEAQMRPIRGGQISMIFQEPMSSLNPVYTIGFQLVEAIRLHRSISESEARRRAIALLQEVKLLPSDEALAEAYREEFARTNPAAQTPEDREVTHQVNRQKAAILDRYPHQLSGGQIQRVMIAMAISCDPQVLIADEPTTALDVTVQATILDLLRQLRDQRQMSIIFISHDLGVIAEIADQVAVMYEGNLVETGSIQQVFAQPQHPYTQGLLACRPRPDLRLRYLPTVADFLDAPQGAEASEVASTGDARSTPTNGTANNGTLNGTTTAAPIASSATNGGPAAVPAQAEEISPEELTTRLENLLQQPPLLIVDDLRVAFPVRGVWGQAKRYVMAVNGVSFQVYPGETLGLVGESGCGKTTLARTLLQLIRPSDGRVEFNGQDITALWQRGRAAQMRRLRQEMQIIFQDPYSSLDPRMSVGAAIMEPLRIHRRGDRRTQQERAVYLLQRVGLDADAMRRFPHEFSGGQRQRICIARALTLNPRFIICDESVSALDVSVQAQVLNLLKEIQAEFGLTYIFISHDLSVVKFMSDRIMVMNRGKIEEIGPAETIYRHPQREYTQQLIAAIPTGNLATIEQQAGG